MTLNVDIAIVDGDDPDFIYCTNNLIRNLVIGLKPNDVYAMRIKKWFDHKWLRYSGKGRVGFPEKSVGFIKDTKIEPVAALDEQFQEHITFPPFNPKQMGVRHYWGLWDDGTYGGVEKPRWPKIHFRSHSSANLQNRVESFSKSGIFVWFSSDTAQNKKGSLMTYTIKNGDTQAWYASLFKNKTWKVEKTKGTSRELAEILLTV